MQKTEKYIIVCDESTKKGKNFSYFFGGAMLKENQYENISTILNDYKQKLGLNELKRTKITEKNYKDYIKVLHLFFIFIKSGEIKIRIMFSPNNQLLIIPKKDNETYSKFYLTFIINAFSVFYAKKPLNLRLIFDDLPETKKQIKIFKSCLINKIKLNKNTYSNNVYLSKSRIEEVDSKKHPILQCVDVLVGLTDFILNSSKTEIKESHRAHARYEVWQYIYNEILSLDEKFVLTQTSQPIYSHKGWLGKYKHFVYKHKKTPNNPT